MKRTLLVVALAMVVAACGGSGETPSPITTSGADVAGSTPTPPVVSSSLVIETCLPPALALLEPRAGVYYGVNLDWGNQTTWDYADHLGEPPAVFVSFASFPLTGDAAALVDAAAGQVADNGSMLLLTLEPHDGLQTVTEETARDLADRLAGYNSRNVPVFLRFAHEMNGSWYPWSQQPEEYIAAFRLIAAEVHARAPLTAMLWAPNYAGGYPFHGGKYEAKPGTAAFAELDTDGDGSLTSRDAGYSPYYPGDDAVDWVGMSLYHWGSAYPWGENELPEAGKFVAQLRGEYAGLAGDDTAIEDFYGEFAEKRGKPLAITETAAFFRPGQDGAGEFEVKRDWWQQVFAGNVHETLPQLKMINWFEWDKFEVEVNDRVNWRVLYDDTAISGAFLAALPDWLLMARDADVCDPQGG